MNGNANQGEYYLTNECYSGLELKQKNRNSVYRIMHREGCVTRQKIVNALGLSVPTVAQHLSDLVKDGLVEEKGSFGNTGGRRARGYCVVPDARYSVGIDISKNHRSIVIVNLLGEMLYSRREYTAFRDDDEYYSGIALAAEHALEECGIDRSKILGAGVALQGIVSSDHRVVSYGEVLGLTGATSDKICKYFRFPSALFHDSDMAAFAEFWNVPDVKEFIYISLSTNLGGAIIDPNSIFRTDHFGKARLEHMTLYPGGKRCYCGQYGCADAYCSTTVLMESIHNYRLETFFEELSSGNEQIKLIWDKYLDDLALVINNTRMMHDCDVVLGGYLGEFLDEYLDDLKRRTYCRNSFDKNDDYIRLCRIKSEPMAIGAALQYIDKFISNV